MGRRAIVLLVALILAGLAAWAVFNYLEDVQEAADAERTVVSVFRAGPGGISEGAEGSILVSSFDGNPACKNPEVPLPESQGCPIKSGTDDLEDTPPDAIQDEAFLREFLTGKVAAGPISEGSILTQAQWTSVTVEIIPLSEQIPSGKQALTISTGAVQGVNGFVEPGDRINMIITLELDFDLIPVDFEGVTLADPDAPDTTEPGAQENVVVTYTRYVMQGIPVIATGREVRPDEDADAPVDVPDPDAPPAEETANETIFTLEVTPDQAERIVFAMQAGSIWLTLVPLDFVEVETDGVLLDNLFGGDLIEEIFGPQGN
ncbi:MAG: Flp pilus assembly protein CpaB [Acidimicrobiia bacterium]|nr:Flp pilus assembly protein CpaB [Acidimicrobiia bacterium]